MVHIKEQEADYLDNWMAFRAVHRLVLCVVYVRQFGDALSPGSLEQLDPLFGLGQTFYEGRNNQRNFLNLLNTMAVGKDKRWQCHELIH